MVVVVAVLLVLAVVLGILWLALIAYTRRGTGAQDYRHYLPSEVQRRVARQKSADRFDYVAQPYPVARVDDHHG